MSDLYSTGPDVLVCTKCKIEKPLDDFALRSGREDKGFGRRGRCSSCKACQEAYRRLPHNVVKAAAKTRAFTARLREHDPERLRRRERQNNLLRLYGIRIADYEAMEAAQAGLCAICQRPPTKGRGMKFHVDHCHATGKIRSLLCDGCNKGLGCFDDDPARLLAAIEYLRRHSTTPDQQAGG